MGLSGINNENPIFNKFLTISGERELQLPSHKELLNMIFSQVTSSGGDLKAFSIVNSQRDFLLKNAQVLTSQEDGRTSTSLLEFAKNPSNMTGSKKGLSFLLQDKANNKTIHIRASEEESEFFVGPHPQPSTAAPSSSSVAPTSTITFTDSSGHEQTVQIDQTITVSEEELEKFIQKLVTYMTRENTAQSPKKTEQETAEHPKPVQNTHQSTKVDDDVISKKQDKNREEAKHLAAIEAKIKTQKNIARVNQAKETQLSNKLEQAEIQDEIKRRGTNKA